MNDPTLMAPDASWTAIFTAGVVGAELIGPGDPASLTPAEADCGRDMSSLRLREFAAGRACARRVLAEFGIAGFSLVPAADRVPVWPAGFTGSITHTTGYCAAMAAPKQHCRSVGLDAELIADVAEDLWPTIANESELSQLRALGAAGAQRLAALIYSAKESFYKCQYTVTGQWLDFHDVGVTTNLHGTEPTFQVCTLRPVAAWRGKTLSLSGRFRFDSHLVRTCVLWPAAPDSS